MVPNGSRNGIKNQRKSNKKRDVKRVDKTCWKFVKFDDLGSSKNEFTNGKLQNITKTRSADKYKQIPKHIIKIQPKSMKIWSRNSTKNDAQKQIPKKQNIFEKWLPNGDQKLSSFWGWRLLGHLWLPKPLLWSKNGPPACPKCSQWSKNKPNMTPKSPPSVKKRSKSQAFSEPGLADCAKRLQ